MAALCRILTAATLVVHMMVGCCAHHAHACKGDLSPAHGDAAHDGQSPGDSHPSHHGANDCQGAKCSMVCSGQPDGDSLVQPFQAFRAVLLDDRPSPAGSGRQRYDQASGRLLLPVRPHLANRVLLI